MAGGHFIVLAADDTDTTLEVDTLQQTAVCHVPFRTALEYLRLLLELDDGNGLVHLCCQALVFLLHRVSLHQLGIELQAGVVLIVFHGKGSQRDEVDAVSLFDGCQVSVAQRQAQHIADAGIVARTGTHPQHVVVTPLDVP